MAFMRRIECPQETAEGLCRGIPYNTELAGADGVSIHFWLGTRTDTTDLLIQLDLVARHHRDIVAITYSDGAPTGFWADQNMD